MTGVASGPTRPTEPRRPTRPRPSNRSARLVWAITLAGLVVIGLAIWMTARAAGSGGSIDAALGAVWQSVSLIAFLLSGAIILARQPRNVVGWLLMAPGLVLPMTVVASSWLLSLDPPPTQVDPLLWVLLWITSWAWLALIFPIFALLQTFPDGRLLSPRWRWLAALEIAMVAVFAGPLTAFSSELGVLQDDQTVWSVPNPIGSVDTSAIWSSGVDTIWNVALLVVTVASVAAVVLRFRRGTPEERNQLKWPMLAIGFFGVVYGFAAVFQGGMGDIWNILFSLAITAIPISIAIAVLKYRLYEIDRIISRTIGWALVTGVLLVIFVALIVASQAVLSMFTQGQTVAVAASTLAVFALFQPVRRRIQRIVDRRFDRARFDAERTSTAFAQRLRNEVDLATVTTDLQVTTEGALAPSVLGVWIRKEVRP